jgi:hypothetical protein
MHTSLEPCEHRVPLTTPEVYFCRHTMVHAKDSIVPDATCAGCPWASVACLQPRDVPDELPTPAPKPLHVPPLYQRLANFTVAAIGHVMAGMPTCTQQQIDERLAICQGCELFKPSKADAEKGVCTHSDCGCNLGREGKFISKLGWSDSSCPLEKWPAISSASDRS